VLGFAGENPAIYRFGLVQSASPMMDNGGLELLLCGHSARW
jgi:hypothetical protein